MTLPPGRLRLAVSAFLLLMVAPTSAARAQETVEVSFPGWIAFDVFDVSRSTTGSPDPARVEFSTANLLPGNVLRIGVRAEASTFTPPSGNAIPASYVSWSPGGAIGGVGASGTLDASAYGLVFQSSSGAASGWVDLTWTLAAPGAGIRAGNHQLTIRWKVESIVP